MKGYDMYVYTCMDASFKQDLSARRYAPAVVMRVLALAQGAKVRIYQVFGAP